MASEAAFPDWSSFGALDLSTAPLAVAAPPVEPDASGDALQHARALREAADYPGALEAFRRAWEAAPPGTPTEHDARLEAGMVLGFMGEFEASLAALRDAVRRWPASPATHLNLGKTLLMLGEYGAARPPLEAAATLAPASLAAEEARKQIDLLKQFGY